MTTAGAAEFYGSLLWCQKAEKDYLVWGHFGHDTSVNKLLITLCIEMIIGRRRPVTRGCAVPIENSSFPLEKCVGYSLKLLDIVQN